MKFDLEKDKLLFLLIFTDLAFVVLHILYVYTNLLSSSLYSLSRDRGFAEFFQYTKERVRGVKTLITAKRNQCVRSPA